MCPFTQVRYKCGHRVYTVRAWCETYERTHVRCKVYVVAYERRYVYVFVRSYHFSGLVPFRSSLSPRRSASLSIPFFTGLTSTTILSTVFTSISHHLPPFPSSSDAFSFSSSVQLYISPYLHLNNKTLTPYQQLRLRSLPTCRRGALDGSPQDPHPHSTPSQPCMAPAATAAPCLEEPTIREMPSINKMVRPASHTTSPTLTSPESLAGIVNKIGRAHV